MSATGRGPRLGGEHDYYSTPAWCVNRLLDEWTPTPGLLIEPSAGEGAIIGAITGRLGVESHPWIAVEAREECRSALIGLPGTEVVIGDFLSHETIAATLRPVSAVVMNPPYKWAEEFVRRARDLWPKADVVALLRLNFLSGGDRTRWLRSDMPNVFVLPNRPSFLGGKTDACEYAWMLWPGEAKDNHGFLNILPETPLAERRRGSK